MFLVEKKKKKNTYEIKIIAETRWLQNLLSLSLHMHSTENSSPFSCWQEKCTGFSKSKINYLESKKAVISILSGGSEVIKSRKLIAFEWPIV